MARCLNVLLLVAVFVTAAVAQTFLCPTTNLTVTGTLTFRRPENCSRTSCDVYVTMAPNTMNSSYLDIYMEGTAAGWVAVGFSNSRAMENTDVIGCRVDSGSTVSVVDTWNPSPNYSPNQLDANQDGVCTHSANFTNSRISCLLSRYAKVINANQDLDLDSPRFIIYGRRTSSNGGSMSLSVHSETPLRITSMVNPFTDSGDAPPPGGNYPRKQLIQTHGILMLIAWPILAAIGIFFASWTRPALPNGEWFQTHRALMVGSLVVTIVGIFFAIVANAMQSPPALVDLNNKVSVTHFVFGILIVVLQVANPLIALCRCKPDSEHRWIFGMFHAFTIGVGADLLAMINVGLGLTLFASFSGTNLVAFWLFIVYIICYLLLEGTLHVVFTIIALKSPPEERHKLVPTSFRSCFLPPQKPADEGTEMKDKEDENKSAAPQRKPPSKDAIVRWVAVGVHLFFTLLIVVAAILVAAG